MKTSVSREVVDHLAADLDVLRVFEGRIDLVLDGGPTAGGLPSTVLDVTVDPPRVLRDGAVQL